MMFEIYTCRYRCFVNAVFWGTMYGIFQDLRTPTQEIGFLAELMARIEFFGKKSRFVMVNLSGNGHFKMD